MAPISEELAAEFQKRFIVNQETHCWDWTSSIEPEGYGRIQKNGKRFKAHRVSYEIYVGKIPDGMVIDHLCRNRKCVNPQHLDVVTISENTKRGVSFYVINSQKTHCNKGHELTDGNLCKYALMKGKRSCMICYRAFQRKYYHRRMREAGK